MRPTNICVRISRVTDRSTCTCTCRIRIYIWIRTSTRKYRPFCAIGSGGYDFVSSIVEKVELALGRTVPKDKILTRPSKEGKWVSVKIGPLYVEDKETVVAVYTEIKKETRVRYCL